MWAGGAISRNSRVNRGCIAGQVNHNIQHTQVSEPSSTERWNTAMVLFSSVTTYTTGRVGWKAR